MQDWDSQPHLQSHHCTARGGEQLRLKIQAFAKKEDWPLPHRLPANRNGFQGFVFIGFQRSLQLDALLMVLLLRPCGIHPPILWEDNTARLSSRLYFFIFKERLDCGSFWKVKCRSASKLRRGPVNAHSCYAEPEIRFNNKIKNWLSPCFEHLRRRLRWLWLIYSVDATICQY